MRTKQEYQEALDEVKDYVEYEELYSGLESLPNSISKLQELIDNYKDKE